MLDQSLFSYHNSRQDTMAGSGAAPRSTTCPMEQVAHCLLGFAFQLRSAAFDILRRERDGTTQRSVSALVGLSRRPSMLQPVFDALQDIVAFWR